MSGKKYGSWVRALAAALISALLIQVAKASGWFKLKGGADWKDFFINFLFIFVTVWIVSLSVKKLNVSALKKKKTSL